mgnify:FL=1
MDRDYSSPHTSLYARGDDLQGKMCLCGPRETGEPESFYEVQMGGYCTCFVCSDEEGRTEGKDAR